MAGNEGSDLNFVTKLIAATKTLTNANIFKSEYQQILKELTLFKNFTTLFYKSSGTQNVLSITAKLVTDSSLQELGENILITVCNNSSAFNLSPKFWQFSVEYFNGVSRRVSSWKLDEPLTKGKSHVFLAKFSPSADFHPTEIKVNVIFTLMWKEHKCVRVLPIGSLLVDVMYFLNPARAIGPLTPFGSSPLLPMSELHTRLQGLEKQCPTVTMFEFQFGSQLTDFFINEIFLRDCLHRGFPPDLIRLNSCNEKQIAPINDIVVQNQNTIDNQMEVDVPNVEYVVYVQKEKITVTVSKNGGSVGFKCSNSKLLFSLKLAIFRRLLACDGIKVVCPDDKTCEKLYAIKLKLEAMGRSPSDRFGDLMELYLELRDVSESVKFIKLSSVD